jgi:asparagine synthase (glutamine-hydrolysing)
MCGIAGFIDFNKNTSEETLKKMTRTMIHRGPDGEGYFHKIENDYSIGFGHRRLSIIDLSAAGTQPMHFQEYSILLNGEIYNYQEIKEELLQLGHTFVSTSDTEVVLHAYREWGLKAVDRFVGMFAIVIHNAKTHELIGIRDRAGVKPFYYYWHENTFLFTSELKAFHQHPSFKKEINNDAVARFLQYGNVPAPHCIFKNTFKLLQGHFLHLDLKNKTLKTEKYWDITTFYNKEKLDISFEEAKKETERIMTKGFAYRMVADVPVGVFLSGGYDSSAVAALLATNASNKINTFTIGMGEAALNEAPYAKKVAEILSTNHTEYYCTEKDALDLIEKLPFYYDEPFGDSSAIPTMLVSALARKDVTVALSADAGDEIFAGYNRYDYVSKYTHRLKKYPAFLRKMAAAGMNILPIQTFSKDPLVAQRFRKIQEIIKRPDSDTLMQILTSEYYDSELNELFQKPIQLLPLLQQSTKIDPSINGEIESMMAIDFNTYMVDDILQKVDRATMSASLEGREPFLDQHIVEWAAQLPIGYKYNKGNKKFIVKEIVHDYIPKEIMDRPKAGFAIPIYKWLSNDLRPILESNLSVASIEQYGILNAKSVQAMLHQFLVNGKKEYTLKLWYILQFQMWCKQWI